MAIEFRILPARGLAYVRYAGVISFPETAEAFGAYMQHPDMRPGQKQLIDLARVTDWDRDFAGLMQLQADKAGAFLGTGHEVHFVYFAPTERTQQMARMILRSWEDVPGVIPLLSETEADALQVLGQPEQTIDALLQSA
ncbi:MAG TPA: hypothetical protein DIU07_21395 [Rhodobacteraceae bacterium]|nr:hypothetical protein [Paracoccaceae bacterium]